MRSGARDAFGRHANHPAISWRSTITTEIFATSWCQPPSHLPAILQRSGITTAMLGNRKGQPPSHLPTISRRFRFTSVFIQVGRANHSAICFCCFNRTVCVVVVLMCSFVLGALIKQVFSQPSLSHLPAISEPSPNDQKSHPKLLEIARANHPAISQPSLGDLHLQPKYLEQVGANHPSHLPAILQRFRITPALIHAASFVLG